MLPSAQPGAPAPLVAGASVWHTFDAWLRRSSTLIRESADALDALNVFPVSDADTGSNLQLTLAGIARAVPDVNRASLDDVVQAAILSAHGNSGAIVAEMFSSVCRSLARGLPGTGPGPAGVRVAVLLAKVAEAARGAVARPVAGTILTVADDAARAAATAAQDTPDDPLAVARAAQAEARAALLRTPDQLDVLAAAGVVDAGGQAFALLVDALVEVLGGEPAVPSPRVTCPAAAPAAGEQEYEVMYAVHDATPEALEALRTRLGEIGSSVVVVGGGHGTSLAQVHVHLVDPGAAVEAALATGGAVADQDHGAGPARGADPRRRLRRGRSGARPGRRGGRRAAAGPRRRASGAGRAGGDPAAQLRGRHRAAQRHGDAGGRDAPGGPAARGAGVPRPAPRRHPDGRPGPGPGRPGGARARGRLRRRRGRDGRGGRARPARRGHHRGRPGDDDGRALRGGDVLGVVDGDFVEIGTDVTEVAVRVTARLLAAGGELLTVVLGAEAPPGLPDVLAAEARRRSGPVEVQVVEGGQLRYPVLLGSE